MRKITFKKIISLLTVFALFISLSACSTKKGTSIMLYTSEPEELVSAMIDKFNESHPEVHIELFRAGTGKVTAKMDEEFAATDGTEANIIWFADIGYIKNLDDKGLITHYVSENAKDVPSDYQYNDGMATELRLIYNVLAYNTAKLDPSDYPKDWYDVTSEAFTGKFALADPAVSGGAFSALVAHINHSDVVGWDWYEALNNNDVKYEESNGNLQTKVASGDYFGVELVDFMARTAKAEGSPVDICYPESGACLVPTPFAILNNVDEDQLAGAKAFLDWTLSEEGQAMFVEQNYIPVNPGVAPPEGAPSAKEVKILPFDLDYFVKNSTDIRNEYKSRFSVAN